MPDFDVITVGGGLGGSALARSLALAGKRVLVVESETEFRDRVRGEWVTSWGVADMQALGIYDALRDSCAREMLYFHTFVGPMQIEDRNLVDTTPQQRPNLTFYHPRMQETLLAEAAKAGAKVMRGASVRNVEPGDTPAVVVEDAGTSERYTARLVAGCDGRNSSVRTWAGFASTQDPDRMQLSGLLVDGYAGSPDVLYVNFDLASGQSSIIFPQGEGRARTYSASRVSDGTRFSGEKDIPGYLDKLRSLTPGGEAWLKDVKPAGPLATFSGAYSYVHGPYKGGVALVGDAAGTSDPTWGQGLSLTVRDARTLRDELLTSDDWDAAGASYAAKHDDYFGHIYRCEDWFTTLFYDAGPEADAIRERAFTLIGEDPTRLPDTMQAGPEHVPATDEARRRFFGEE